MNIEDKRKTKLVKLDTLEPGDMFCTLDIDANESVPYMLLYQYSLTSKNGVTLDEAYDNSYACVNLDYGEVYFITKEEYVRPLYSKLIISNNKADIE